MTETWWSRGGGVEMWRGGLGSAYLVPALSSAGASLSGPCSVSTSRSSNRTCLSQASGSRRRLTQLPTAIACDAACDSRKQIGSLQAHRQSPFLRRFLRPPSTRAPSLHRRYPASSVLRAPPPSQSARPFSRELPVDPYSDHRWDFPCYVWSSLPACRRHYPGRSDGNLFARTFPSSSAFPVRQVGRLLHQPFRGLLSVYSRYGLHARQVAYATFYTEGFSSFVASAAAPIATGWSEPVPGRDFPPAEDQRLFTAH